MKKKNKFKAIATTVFLLIAMSGAMAQGTDSFFNYEDGDYREDNGISANGFTPSNNGLENASLGGGLLILTSLGVIYAVARRKEEK